MALIYNWCLPSAKIMVMAYLLLQMSCAPPRPAVPRAVEAPTEKARATVRPADLVVEPGDGKMTLIWAKAGAGLMSGYNIYTFSAPISGDAIVSAALDTLKPLNLVPYPGDTNPDDNLESFEADNLENGVKYYAFVRVIYPDRSLSVPSNVATTVCGPRGSIDLAARFQSDHDGYSLLKNRYVRADASDNDILFFTKDGRDYLASPGRLDGFLRKTTLTLLPVEGGVAEVRQYLRGHQVTTEEDRLQVKTGSWVLLQTIEGYHALLKVLDVTGRGKERHLRATFAVCPLADELVF